MMKNAAPIGDYEIKQLKIFKVVADCGGFSAAETELNISRSTISIHISNLESRLNLTLCRRGRSGFALTEEGAVVYEATVKLLGELERFRNIISHLDVQLSGSLTVLFSDNPLAQMPQKELNDDIINAFPVVYAGIKSQELLNAQLPKMNLKATAYNYESRLALILSSKFIGYLPENYAQSYVDSGQLIAITPATQYYHLEIMAITKKTNSTNKIRSLFIKTMRDFYLNKNTRGVMNSTKISSSI